MKSPLISCIVPVYNGERYVKEALDSILAQTYRLLEIIVVDDGSTDRTVELLANYGEQIRYLEQPHVGPAAARNLGVGTAQGEFIAFLDADDLWHPEKLARQMARFRDCPDINLCFACFQNFWTRELAEEEKRYQGHPMSQPLSAYSICSLLAPHTAFERFGNFDNDLRGNENMHWFLHAAERGAVIEVLPDVLMYRRIHPHNRSRRGNVKNVDLFFPILKAWRDYQKRGLPR